MNRDTALLQLVLTPGLGARTLGRLLRRLAIDRYPIEDFVTASVSELADSYDIKPDIAEAIRTLTPRARELSEELDRLDIRMVEITDPDYPPHLADHLGKTAPPLLFTRGCIELLRQPTIGIAGARACSETGLAIARDCAATLAREGVNIVSGYAPGIDTAAHTGALQAGGATTIIAVTGLLAFRLKNRLNDLWNEQNTLIVSEFPPEVGWQAHNAMQRNRTICGLSHTLLIVESALSGGTFASGNAALELGCPLYVIDYPEPPESAAGNEHFLRRGARPVTVDANGEFHDAVLRSMLTAEWQEHNQKELF